MKLKAKKPYTTVGIAARISSKGFTIAVKRGGAYSLRYTAMVRPRGNATRMAMKLVKKVPATNGRIPNFLFAKRGVHSVPVKNSTMETSLKKPMDS